MVSQQKSASAEGMQIVESSGPRGRSRAAAAALRTREFRNILLIKLSAVGDVIHTIPVLNKLRRR